MYNLISGSGGFIGRNLIPYLEHAGEICQVLPRTVLQKIDSELLGAPKAIIHLAGKAHDLKNISDASEYYQVNFELTKKLYEAFLKSDASIFIYISSVKACRDVVQGVLTEEFEPTPETDYGKSKLMAENYIMRRTIPVEKKFYILRPCMIHGPGNKGNLNLLYKLIKKGLPYPLGAYRNQRSFLSVQNFCFIIRELLNKNISSGIYNVADDECLSTNEVVRLLSQPLERQVPILKIPPVVINMIAKIGDLFALPLTTEKISKLTENFVVDNSKIKNALGVNLPLSVRDGLIITAKSFASQEK